MAGRGRPPGLDPVPSDKADAIVAWLSSGKTLAEFCRQPGMPSWRSVYDWMEKDPVFAARIARARELGHDAISEECLKIADNMHIGQRVETSETGVKIIEEDSVQHRKLQIETRLKLLAKWNPKRYGEKAHADEQASTQAPIRIELVAPAGKTNDADSED